jgi:hypothetical protein
MRPTSLFAVSLASTLMFGALALAAEEASVTILSPVDGATLDVMEQNKVEYQVVPGPRGDHVHFYVNGEETAILRQLEGSHTMGGLAPGTHEICIKVVNKNHTPIGVEKCIGVILE